MALDFFMVIANQYDREVDAVADFEAVRGVYGELGISERYDAAVLSRRRDGKSDIVKWVEQPAREGIIKGLAFGLAVGSLMALVPSVGLVTGVLAGGGVGAGAGIVAGHVAGGMRRNDLRTLGELLDNGASGLLVVAPTDMEARAEAAITRANRRAKGLLRADTNALLKAIATD